MKERTVWFLFNLAAWKFKQRSPLLSSVEIASKPSKDGKGLAYCSTKNGGRTIININPSAVVQYCTTNRPQKVGELRFLRNIVLHIVAHEMSHVAAIQQHGSDVSSHGKEWLDMMKVIFDIEHCGREPTVAIPTPRAGETEFWSSIDKLMLDWEKGGEWDNAQALSIWNETA